MIRTEEAWTFTIRSIKHRPAETELNVSDGERTRYRCRGKRKLISASVQLGGSLVLQVQPDGSRLLVRRSGVSLLTNDPLMETTTPVVPVTRHVVESAVKKLPVSCPPSVLTYALDCPSTCLVLCSRLVSKGTSNGSNKPAKRSLSHPQSLVRC
jgi:hypothetical protein